MVNGVTDLVVTKIDVLDGFETINVCTEYEQNCHLMEEFPFEYTDDIKPVYRALDGWRCDSTKFSKASQFPGALNDFLTQLELTLGVNVSHVSNGTSRDQIVST